MRKSDIRGGRLNFTYDLILYMSIFFGKHVLHCNGIGPFVMLMDSFNLGTISRNDIVST